MMTVVFFQKNISFLIQPTVRVTKPLEIIHVCYKSIKCQCFIQFVINLTLNDSVD